MKGFEYRRLWEERGSKSDRMFIYVSEERSDTITVEMSGVQKRYFI